MKEQRMNQRYDFNRRIIYGLNVHPSFIGFAKNISREGMFFISRHLLREGTRLHFVIRSDSNQFYKAEGVVLRNDESTLGLRYDDGYGLGIGFTAMQDALLGQLTDPLVVHREAKA